MWPGQQMRRFNGKSIRCLGGTYRLSFVPLRTDPNLNGENSGLTDLLMRFIKVISDAPADQQKDVLLHEIVHIADYETGAPSDRVDEVTITRIAKGLFAIFRDNPGLAEWIAGEEDE